MKFQGEIILWRLTAAAADPDGSRPVDAEAAQTADGSWSIVATTFQTPPLTSDHPKGTVPVVLKENAAIAIAGARVAVTLTIGFSFISKSGLKSPLGSTLTITLDNTQAVVVKKPVLHGEPRQVRLEVRDYDPATGSFEVAGAGKLQGLLSQDPVALHVKGHFVPPI